MAQHSGVSEQPVFRLGRNPNRYDVPDSPEQGRVQRWLLRYSVEHLHGPEEVLYEKDELIVLCLMRNGRQYLESFIEHYLSLGAKHIVFLDNGSTDGTVEALLGYDNVTVLRTGLPYRKYMILMKQYLIERFGRDRWSLSVDIDELFDYPYSDTVCLKDFLSYLNEHSFTAVVAHMLDLFPEEPLSEANDPEDTSLKERNRFYEISHVIAHEYKEVGDIGNVISNEEIKFYQNGVQRRVFGIGPLLSKHPLIFLDDRVKPMDLSDHWAGNARVADLTGVLLHYKLTRSLYELVRREMEERRYLNRHGKYDKYHEVLENNPSLKIKSGNSRELDTVDDLVENGFLTVSANFMELVQRREPDRLVRTFFGARFESRLQEQRIEKLEARLKGMNRQVGQLREEIERKDTKAASLERQLNGIASSKSWRLLDGINRLRKEILLRLVRKYSGG